MNKHIIVDSSALVSLITDTNSNHQKAITIATKILKTPAKLILPYEVFAETMNVLGKKSSKREADIAANYLFEYHKSGTVIFPEPKTEIVKGAMGKFMKLTNSVSFTDCLVMAIADAYETEEIFGFDQAFRKNGYILPGTSQ